MLAISSMATCSGKAAVGVEEGGPLGRVEVDGVFQLQSQAVARTAEDLFVVGALVFVPEEERLHPRASEGVAEFVGAVGGIHVDQGGSGAGAAHVHHDPFNAVGGPEADTIAAANAKRPEPARDAVCRLAELGPGHAAGLMARSDGEAIGEAAGSSMEEVANGQLEQGTAGAGTVAQCSKGLVNGHTTG